MLGGSIIDNSIESAGGFVNINFLDPKEASQLMGHLSAQLGSRPIDPYLTLQGMQQWPRPLTLKSKWPHPMKILGHWTACCSLNWAVFKGKVTHLKPLLLSFFSGTEKEIFIAECKSCSFPHNWWMVDSEHVCQTKFLSLCHWNLSYGFRRFIILVILTSFWCIYGTFFCPFWCSTASAPIYFHCKRK